MERVFEEHEMFERFNFSQMMLHYFKPCAPQKSQLSGMTATELYRLFLVHNTHSQLTSGIVHNILLMGGYVQRETGAEMELFAEVDETAFIEAPREIQMVILRHITGPMEVKYRQIVLGLKIKKVHADGSYELIDNPVTSVTMFISRWTLNRNDRYHYYLKPAQRSTLLEVYNFYRFICVTYGFDIVSKRVFYEAVEKMGYTITTGAVHGKAGYRYFKGLFIPQSTDDIKLSLDINAVAIFNGRTHWTKDNELVENYTEALLSNLKESNLRRLYGGNEPSKKTSSFEQLEDFDYGRKIENIQTPVSIPEASVEERAEVEKRLADVISSTHKVTGVETSKNERTSVVEVDNVPNSEPEDAYIEPEDLYESDDVEPEDLYGSESEALYEPEPEPESEKPIQLTGSLSDVIRVKTDRHIVKNSAAKRILAEFDPSNYTADDSEQSISGESMESVASFEEIAEAMKIPYRMNPKEFTLDVFSDWLNKMGINCPDVKAYYKHVMPLITQ